MKEIQFGGKVAVITGAASGMGLYSAREFVRLGAKVIMCDVNEAALAQAAAEIGEAAVPVCGDVRNCEYAEAVAAEAAKLIRPEDTIYLGVGTTVQAMVQYMKGLRELTVFTNALRTAVELSELPGCSVILPGGQLRSKELTLSGFPAEENLVHFNVDKAFVGIGGITEEGVTDFHIGEARLHRQLIKNARQSIALADSSKLGVRAMNNVCTLQEIDIIITDDKVSKQTVKMLEQAGVKVIIAQE